MHVDPEKYWLTDTQAEKIFLTGSAEDIYNSMAKEIPQFLLQILFRRYKKFTKIATIILSLLNIGYGYGKSSEGIEP